MSTSTLAPDKRDRRFTDVSWTRNPLLRRIRSSWPQGRTVDRLVAAADLDWRDEQRVRFLAEDLIAALSPSNVPLHNPTSAKMAINTVGLSLAWSGAAPTCSRTRARPPVKPIFGSVSQVTQTGIIGGVAEQDRRPHGAPARRLTRLEVQVDIVEAWTWPSARRVKPQRHANRHVGALAAGMLAAGQATHPTRSAVPPRRLNQTGAACQPQMSPTGPT